MNDNNEIMNLSETSETDPSTYLDNQAYLPFGGGSLNLHEGKITYRIDDLQTGGVALPFVISHLFKNANTSNTYYGRGWNLSVNRKMWYYTESSGFPFYETEYGDTIYFSATDDENVYTDVCDLDMTFRTNTDDGLELSDKYGNKMYFNGDGWLWKTVDTNGNYVTIERSGERPVKITDSFGRVTTLTYTNNLLSSITDPSGRTVTYEYNSSKDLIKIMWADGISTELTYAEMGETDSHKVGRKTFTGLVKIKELDNTITVLKYDEDAASNSFGRVNRIEKYREGGDNTGELPEDHIDISYIPRQTYIVPSGGEYVSPGVSTVTYKNGISKIIYFDVNGRPTFAYEYKSQTANGVEIEGRRQVIGSAIYEYENHKRTYVSSVVQDEDEINLLEDGSFEEYSSTNQTWERSGLTDDDSATSTDSIDDGKCFKFTSEMPSGINNKSIWQTIPGTKLTSLKGEYLTLSGWAKSGGTYGLSMSATVTYTDSSTNTVSQKFNLKQNTWLYTELPIKIDKEKKIDNIKVSISSTSQSIYYFDNIRLENSPVKYSQLGSKYTVEEDEDVTVYSGSFANATITVFGTRMDIDEEIKSSDGIYISQTITNTAHDIVRTMITDGDGNTFKSYYQYDDKHRLVYSQDYRGIITKNTYNDVGMVTSVKSWYSDEMNPNTITEPGEYFLKTMTYDETGEFLIKDGDQRMDSIYTGNEYDKTKCLLKSTTTPNGQKTSYTYDPNNDFVTKVSAILEDTGAEYSVLYGYTNRRLTSITHNGFDYSFTYDGMGRAKDVKIAGTTYSTNDYVLSDTTTVTTTYATGEKMKVETDRFQQPIKSTYTDKNGTETVLSETEYDSIGRVKKTIDKADNMTYNYTYDGFGNITESDDGETYVYNTFDSNNRLVSYDIQGGDLYQTFKPIYEKNAEGKVYPDNSITGIEYEYQFKSDTSKDIYGRPTERDIDVGSKRLLTETYRYLRAPDDAGFRLTTMVESITQKFGNDEETIRYTYDNNGNIIFITKGDELLARYEYDGMNQLIREDNKLLDRSYIYEYDTAGNITAKWEHTYIFGELPDSFISRKLYAYETTGWKDKLTSYDCQSITYDALGNPLSYLGHTLTWDRVRQLKSFDDNTFEYDAQGRRTKKNGIWYDYQNGKLYREGRPNGDRITYFYDASGICGFNYRYNWRMEEDTYAYIFDDVNYFYKKNLQGDITAIYTATGTKVAEYLYDSWGNCTITYDLDGIGSLNPIRYRGYYYDTETNLYYLNSRYYDPNTSRFINADVGITTKQGILGYNLYTYCLNNPVAMIDSNGMNADVAGWWASSMWWLCGADTVLPVGDIIYLGVAALLLVTGTGTLAEAPAISIPNIKKKEAEKLDENEKESEKDSTQTLSYNYWAAEIIEGIVTPIAPLTYSEAFDWAASGNNLLCINHAAAIAIVKFFPSARWEPAHRGGLDDGYLNHYHLSTAHRNHIWYYGV